MRGDKREYKLASDSYTAGNKIRAREIRKFEGGDSRCVLVVPDEYAMETRAALEIAHRDGREARSEEILGSAGLARAAAEVGRHEPDLHVAGLSCAGEDCGYFDPEADGEKWDRHVAYAVLQAAARLP
jgi:hypothetical protein